MRVFLCLCDTRLLLAVLCQEFSEGIGDLIFYKGNQFVFNSDIIFSKAYKGGLDPLASVKTFKLLITEGSGNLSGTVRAEVKEDDGIIVLYLCHRNAVLFYHRRKHELIRGILIVGSLDPCRTARCPLAFAEYQRPVGLFHAVPAIVTVHGIVASHNGRHLSHADLLHLRCQLLYIFLSGSRRRITAVQEAVYVYVLDSLSLSQFQQPVNVLVMAVDAAI